MRRFYTKDSVFKGWDFHMTAPGKESSVQCRVCGSEMDVSRDVVGPMSYAQAVNRETSKHDEWKCPNSGQGWHTQALLLLQDIEKCNSRNIANMMKVEVREIIQARKPTLVNKFTWD